MREICLLKLRYYKKILGASPISLLALNATSTRLSLHSIGQNGNRQANIRMYRFSAQRKPTRKRHLIMLKHRVEYWLAALKHGTCSHIRW